jgi:hypothetical protein
MGCCFVLARFFVWMGLFRGGSSGEWGQVITLRQLSEDAQKYIYRGKREKKRETTVAWLLFVLCKYQFRYFFLCSV